MRRSPSHDREHQMSLSHINHFVLSHISPSNAVDCCRKMDTPTTPLHISVKNAQGHRSSNLIATAPSKGAASADPESSENSSTDLWCSAGPTLLMDCDTECDIVVSHFAPQNPKVRHDHGERKMTCPDTVENDTLDPSAPVRQPLHKDMLELKRTPSVGFATTPNEILDPVTIPSNKMQRRFSPFGLTLSAFRRPENTVRIADMDPTRKITTDYDFDAPECHVLGHGASSTVRLAVRRSDGVQVAVKSVAKHEALRFRGMRHLSRRHLDEWELLRSLRDNPHVVKLLDVYETDEEIQLVLEYCQGGELFDVIQAKRKQALESPDKQYEFSESRAANIVLQMLSVLAELHSRGIVHRDVKPENILLHTTDSSRVCAKLSDFGTSRELHPEEESDSCSSDGEASPLTPRSRNRAYSAVGSNFYAAPEVHAGHGYDTAVDMYSLGVTLYVILCGFPPSFTANDEDDVVTFPESHWRNISNDAKDLIRKMLHSDASCRITAAEALRDSWIVRQTQLPATRFQTRNIYSPDAPRPVVDMELVRSRLFGRLDSDSEEDSTEQRGKRRKLEQEPALIEAMAELCHSLESAASSAAAAAAGVVLDEHNDVRVVEEIDERSVAKDGPRVTSPFESSFTALSV